MSEMTTVPPVLYVPVRHNAAGDVEVVRMPMGEGKLALLAYTALDRLAKGCGEGQEWVMIFTSTLTSVKGEMPFVAVAFDVEFPNGLGRAIAA